MHSILPTSAQRIVDSIMEVFHSAEWRRAEDDHERAFLLAGAVCDAVQGAYVPPGRSLRETEYRRLRNSQIMAGYHAGDSVAVLARRHHLSQRHVRRILGGGE